MKKDKEKKTLRILVAAYRCFPDFSASSLLVNNLLQKLGPDSFVLAGQRYLSSGGLIADTKIWHPEPNYINTVKNNGWFNRKIQILAPFSIPKIARRLEHLGLQSGCKQVLGIYPNIPFLGGAALAAERLGVPFFAWLHNTPQAMQGNRFYNGNLELERRILGRARCVFAMSDAMRDEYKALYPELAIETLSHPFDLVYDHSPEPNFNLRPVRLFFSGGVNESNANALGNIIDAVKTRHDKYELHLCTRQSISSLTKRFGSAPNLHYHGFVSDESLLGLYRRAHILVLPHGLCGKLAGIEYRTIFPTKTISYMMANRPIFAHVPCESGIDNYLKNTKVAYINYNGDSQAIIEGLDFLVKNRSKRIEMVENCVKVLPQFDAENVARLFRKKVLAAS